MVTPEKKNSILITTIDQCRLTYRDAWFQFFGLEVAGKKGNFCAHIRQHAGIFVEKPHFDQNSCLAAVNCRHNGVNLAAKSHIRQSIKLDVARLADPNGCDAGFRYIYFYLQGTHIGNCYNGGFGCGGGSQRSHDIADISIFSQHHSVKWSPDQSVVKVSSGACKSRSCCYYGGIG